MSEAVVGEPLYGPAFQQDPAAVYRRLRGIYGAAAPVELEPGVFGYVLLEHEEIRKACWDTVTWSHNARRWRAWREGGVPSSSQVLPMLEYRRNVLFADGDEHERMRQAVEASLANLIGIPGQVTGLVDWAADYLIGRLPRSRAAEVDLVRSFTAPLPVLVLAALFGLGPDQGLRLLGLLPRLWDADQAEAANAEYEQYMNDLVAAKRARPGPDLTSWLLHAGLSEEEVREHLVLMVGAGCAPTAELLANALRLLLTDASLRRALRGQELPIADAVHTVLWRLGPMEIYPWIYPTRDVCVAGQVIAEGTPVGLALAAANLAAAEAAGQGVPNTNRAHLAYGVGPHACPGAARRLAHQIVSDAIAALVERVDGLRLAVPPERLHRRPSIFAQALVALPVTYTRTRPASPAHTDSPVPAGRRQDGGSCPAHQPNRSSWTPQPGPAPSASSSTTSGRWSRWRFLARRRGR